MYSPSALAGFSEDELVLLAQDSDNAAFDELVKRSASTAMKLALSILRDRQEAEDELQNSYFKAWRYVNQFQRESRFSTWISRIVINQCLMRLRRLRRASMTYLDDLNGAEPMRLHELAEQRGGPEEAYGAAEWTAVVQKEIQRLPLILREVLLLRDVQELSTAEAANRLKITGAAVKSRLMRARLELRFRLEKYSSLRGQTRFAN